MKKSAVAVAVIVVLGAAWTGASWYTGTLLEERMAGEVTKANDAITQYFPKAGVKLSYEDYQRHLFSTDVRFTLQADPAFKGESALKPDQKIVLKEAIDHGPFPLSQLKRFNLIPSMASVHTELENTPAVKAIFDATKGQSPFDINSRIAYSGDTSSRIDFVPVDFVKDKTSIKFSGATIDADVGRDLSAMKMTIASDSLFISAPNQHGETENLTLQGLSLDNDTKLGKFGLSTGTQKILVKKLNLGIDGQDGVQLENFALDGIVNDGSENDINGALTYTLDAFKIKDQDFGSGKANIKFSGIDGAQLKKFSEQYNALVTTMLAKGENIDPDAYQEQVIALLGQNLPALLASKPTIQLQPLSWKNSQGESTFTLDITLNDPQKGTRPELGMLNAIGKLDAALNLSVPMATQWVKQSGEMMGYSGEDAASLAQEKVDSLAAMGEMFKLTKKQDNSIISTLHYADGVIDLNGQKMSAEELLQMMMSQPEGFEQAPDDAAPEQTQPSIAVPPAN
ncbi:YdgA family protein [Enterobacillus tribolii]|uniref:Uncharacterized protein YdgA (DUF945 family) n=1 Tax=Enterobacillus tribolii TaxID=1487935 RepID=A0A370R3Y1_9GAMM|nr:YdgA family protein [Enterobacillus tribolii]MBW7984404.1 DUF945 domain-containing protein [Enterobacillus tribolii]RDK97142.1 uncharacterized protein YdgA (DUF945 family) [Enterobacillus tribolii]